MSTAYSSPRLTSNPANHRLIGRLAAITDRRPGPPRGFTVNNRNLFQWVEPEELNFTHYHLRIDSDGDGALKYVFPVGQTCVQLFVGSQFFLSAFNQVHELESIRVRLIYDAEAAVFGGGSGAASYVETHDVTSTSYSFTTAYTPAAGNLLTLQIDMNSSASAITFSWSSDFDPAPLDNEIDTTQGTFTLVTFTGIASKWACTSVRTGLS